MITVTAVGFIGEKPVLQMVGRDSQKVEFDVIWNRRASQAGAWKTVWERATFVAWGEEAENIATTLEKGNNVSCTGLQETSEWMDASGTKKYKARYRLTAWIRHHTARPQQEESQGRQSSAGHSESRAGRPPRHEAPEPGQRESFDQGDDREFM